MTKSEPFQFEQPRDFLRSCNVGAIYSDTVKTYRYAAWKMWDVHRPYVNFLLDFPGPTEEPKQDAILTRLAERVTQWGLGADRQQWGGVVVTCLFAYRCADLEFLGRVARDHPAGDVVGMPKNVEAIARFAQQAGLVVVGWDRLPPALVGRVAPALDLLRSMFVTLYAVQTDATGRPVHPLAAHVSRRPAVFG